jgi:hypothetical protein
VELQLVVVQVPILVARAAQSLRPAGRTYYLVGPLMGRNVDEGPADVQDVPIGAVAPHRRAVIPPNVGGPAIVVGVRQASCVASKVHTQSLPLNSPLSSRSSSGFAVRRILSIL